MIPFNIDFIYWLVNASLQTQNRQCLFEFGVLCSAALRALFSRTKTKLNHVNQPMTGHRSERGFLDIPIVYYKIYIALVEKNILLIFVT